MSYHAGWDAFTPAPGTEDKMYCKVCNAEMNVKRNVDGPTSSIGAMAGIKHLHDTFTCGHSEEDWHIQVRILKQRVRDESSATIANLLTEEINNILFSKRTTRDLNWKYK